MISGAAAAVVRRRAALLPQCAVGVGVASGAAFAISPAAAAVVAASAFFPSAALPTPGRPTARLFSSGAGARKTPTIPRVPAPTAPTTASQRLPLGARQWLGQPRWASPAAALRRLSTTRPMLQQKPEKEQATTTGDNEVPAAAEAKEEAKEEEVDQHLAAHGFQRSAKAAKAAHINMSARLSKEGVGAKGKPGVSEVWRLVKIARPEVRWLGAAFVLLLISSAVTMSIPFSVGRIMDLSTKGPMDEVEIFGLTLRQFFYALAAVLTIGASANFGRIILLRIVGERVVSRLRTQLYRRTYVQDAEFFDANRVGDLISRLSSDTVIVGKSITQNMSDGLRALVSGAAGFIMMAWMSPKLTSIIFVMVPPIAIGAVLYGRSIRHLSRQIQKNLGSMVKIAEERLGNVKTSQAFAGEVQEINRYSKQVRKIFALGKKESLISGTFFASTSWAGNMTILAMLIVGGNLVRDGIMSIGDLTSFMMYTAFAGSSLFGLSGFYSELMKGVGAASRLFELQDRKPTIHQTAGVKVKSALGPIRFSNVTFAYPTRPAVNIFNGIDFEIPSGANVCIVGPSGGGKSTVASLILRFYNPTTGTISINGVDISKMNVKSLRRRVGMVAQEPVLFSGTIAENISYGKPAATRGEIIAAAKKANCGFISDFPDGLETQVGARGAQLSGGQKQRIAIARALLKDPDILLLDEATSALDAESETLVNEALAALLEGRSTTISIAHRLSTIKRSDQIIVLSSEGTVAEIGSYAALSADKDSAFSRLMEWQMSGGEVPADQRPPSAGGRITQAEEIEQELEQHEEDDMEEGAEETEEVEPVEEEKKR